jgi:hypothetical protein
MINQICLIYQNYKYKELIKNNDYYLKILYIKYRIFAIFNFIFHQIYTLNFKNEKFLKYFMAT